MKRFFVFALSCCLLLTGCAAPAPEPLWDAADPALPPSASADDDCDDYGPMSAFSAALFSRTLQTGERNPVLSPASAYLCLAMVQNGADTDTLREFERVLGADTDALNRMCRAFVRSVADVRGDTVLSVANAVFADDDGVRLHEDYLQTLVEGFGADAFAVDLPSDAALDAVNAWVSDKTHGMIPTLHDTNYPDDTMVVLLNTLYFKAQWQHRFERFNTCDKDFRTTGGQTVSVPFLRAFEQTLPVFDSDEAEGVVLPYDDGKTAFVALMPRDGDARAFAATLAPGAFADCVAGAADTLVNLSLPKFTVEFGMNMSDCLKDMGLSLAFDPFRADLTRMGAGEHGPLYLSWVIQKVKLIVDEEGTEAAAVTEAAAAEGAALLSEPPRELHFDRPFVYAVLDLDTMTPLFVGVMDDPSAA